MAGGSFWRGFGQGLITSGLNHAAHSGMFGEGLAISLVTGKTRHIFGADAISLDVGVDAAGGGGGHAHKTEVLMLRGNEKGKAFTMDETGLHGGLAFGGSIGLTRIYYSGFVSSLKHSLFTGRSWAVSGSAGIVGFSGSYANTGDGHFAVSIGTSLGLGLPQYTFGPYTTSESSWNDFIYKF